MRTMMWWVMWTMMWWVMWTMVWAMMMMTMTMMWWMMLSFFILRIGRSTRHSHHFTHFLNFLPHFFHHVSSSTFTFMKMMMTFMHMMRSMMSFVRIKFRIQNTWSNFVLTIIIDIQIFKFTSKIIHLVSFTNSSVFILKLFSNLVLLFFNQFIK